MIRYPPCEASGRGDPLRVIQRAAVSRLRKTTNKGGMKRSFGLCAQTWRGHPRAQKSRKSQHWALRKMPLTGNSALRQVEVQNGVRCLESQTWMPSRQKGVPKSHVCMGWRLSVHTSLQENSMYSISTVANSQVDLIISHPKWFRSS